MDLLELGVSLEQMAKLVRLDHRDCRDVLDPLACLGTRDPLENLEMMDYLAALGPWAQEETLAKMELWDLLDLQGPLDLQETGDHPAPQELEDFKGCQAKEENLESLVRMAMLVFLVSQE